MAAFEFGNYPPAASGTAGSWGFAPVPENATVGVRCQHCGMDRCECINLSHPPGKLCTEPVLAMKIYDSCRSKDCLAAHELGPARDCHGSPINAPDDAQSVLIENLRAARITVMKKEPSLLKKGYWDMDIQYVFNYDLKFFGPEGKPLGTLRATNTFNHRRCLFGSVGQEISLFTDLLGGYDNIAGGGPPFVMVEAKAVPLTAEIKHHHHGKGEHCHKFVFVTIGLFSIIKLYRLVSLLVESRGFVIPQPCRDVLPPNPCDFFEQLCFPMDAFAPLQKEEFKASVGSGMVMAEEF